MRNCIAATVMWILVIYLSFHMVSAQAETSNQVKTDMKRAIEECTDIYENLLMSVCQDIERQLGELGKFACIEYLFENGIDDDTLKYQLDAMLKLCQQRYEDSEQRDVDLVLRYEDPLQTDGDSGQRYASHLVSVQSQISTCLKTDVDGATTHCTFIYEGFFMSVCPNVASQDLEAAKIDCINYYCENGLNDDTLANPYMTSLKLCFSMQSKRVSEQGWLKWLWENRCKIIGALAGTAAAPVVIPYILGIFGFAAGGIKAGSIAASMMSASAITKVGGAIVSILQSVGAAGVGMKTALFLKAVWAYLLYYLCESFG